MNERQPGDAPTPFAEADLLHSLLEISVNLSATRDRRAMLEMILSEARRLTGAQAGSLYVRHKNRLEFVVAQNDAVDVAKLEDGRLSSAVEVGTDSLAGFAAKSGRIINIPDAYRLSAGAPFRVNRDFDAATGYRTQSILAMPLTCPDEEVVGVLQLINRLNEAGAVVPFPCEEDAPVMSLASMAAVSIQNALLMERLKQANLDTIIRLAVVAEFRDRSTAEHIQRISHLCAMTARSMQLDAQQIELIQCASPMHDIGKIGVPDSILLKPAPLTPDERKVVETHTLIGAEILRNPANELMHMAHDIALYHHERWNGTGYPERIKGERIPLSARIVCLADVFDALATKRCYKNAYPMDKVVEIIRKERGKQFDPRILDAFFEVFDEAKAGYGS